VLLEFVGEKSILDETSVRKRVSKAGIEAERVDHVIGQIVGLTFFGVEVAAGKFAYSDEKKERQKNRQLATKFADAEGVEPRYEIDAPFRMYLELNEADSSPPVVSFSFASHTKLELLSQRGFTDARLVMQEQNRGCQSNTALRQQGRHLSLKGGRGYATSQHQLQPCNPFALAVDYSSALPHEVRQM